MNPILHQLKCKPIRGNYDLSRRTISLDSTLECTRRSDFVDFVCGAKLRNMKLSFDLKNRVMNAGPKVDPQIYF